MIYNFIPTDTTFTVVINGVTYGPWARQHEIDDVLDIFNYLEADDNRLGFSFLDPYLSHNILFPADEIQVSGVEQTGTMHEIFTYLKDNVIYLPVEVGEGGEGEAARFGIEDNTGVQNRAVDMEDFNLVLSNPGTFKVRTGDYEDFTLAESHISLTPVNFTAYTQDDNEANYGALQITPTNANLSNVGVNDSLISAQTSGIDIHTGSGPGINGGILITPTLNQISLNNETSGIDINFQLSAGIAQIIRVINDVVNSTLQFPTGAGTHTIATMPPATAYASNALAVAALGVGKLYKSTTLINDSPIILLTV